MSAVAAEDREASPEQSRRPKREASARTRVLNAGYGGFTGSQDKNVKNSFLFFAGRKVNVKVSMGAGPFRTGPQTLY